MTESIGDYLIRRIGQEDVDHVFGVPGDYCLAFFSLLERSPIRVINFCDEQGAGFAADARVGSASRKIRTQTSVDLNRPG